MFCFHAKYSAFSIYFPKRGTKRYSFAPHPFHNTPGSYTPAFHVAVRDWNSVILWSVFDIFYFPFNVFSVLFCFFFFFLRSDVLQPTMCKLQRSCTFFVFGLRNLQCPFFDLRSFWVSENQSEKWDYFLRWENGRSRNLNQEITLIHDWTLPLNI